MLSTTILYYTAINGWVCKKRQRKLLNKYLSLIDKEYKGTTSKDKDHDPQRLDKLTTEIRGLLKDGKISESQYEILKKEISEYFE
ncbi:MAG: hypothetical protein WAK17_12470 [Candidatus Nitrosopolaris sp.]|jgi:hypothetical protein